MITKEEYQQRRRLLAEKLPENAVAIIASSQETLRNGDAHYRFRQNSDFYYLSGFEEPDALLLIMAGDGSETYLFNRPRHPEQEQWTGKRLGQEQAPELLGIKTAYSIDDLEAHLSPLLADKTAVYYTLGISPSWDKSILKALQSLKTLIRKGIKAPDAICSLDPLLSEMRLFKSKAEIALMRKVASISVQAHKRAMKVCKKLNYEYQLEAEFMHELIQQGCRNVAYDPIVGSGANTCILHYTANNNKLNDNDLVLIDAGGELDNYAADITRTYPVNGQFTTEQAAIYNLVLKAQKAGIYCIKPGVSWSLIQETMVNILTQGLCELGLLKGNPKDLIQSGAYKPFYMHNSGHWLGLDVHDCGVYKKNQQWRTLEPGMVLTVEPGLYIQAGMSLVPERWWNIGVRIEDDILVTEQGYENFTQALPVEVAEIEALMRG